MDTSEEYINMVEKAHEMQPLNVQYCDNVYVKIDFVNGGYSINNACGLWLPRQDQLQHMLIKEGNWLNAYHMLQMWLPEEEWNSVRSFEQIWLIVVMKAYYDKKWDNEKKNWVTL